MKVLKLEDDHKIYWMNNPIAYILKGKNYLNPKLDLIVDEAIDLESKEKLKANLEKIIYAYIKNELSDLVNLSKSKFENNYVELFVINCLKTME